MTQETQSAARSQHDEAMARYLALRPWDYYDLERLELEPRLTYLGGGTLEGSVLHLSLRAPATGGRLVLAFFGVEQLRLQTAGYVPFRLSITSIRDRQWEQLRYVVHEEEEDTLQFYCARFEATIQTVNAVPDQQAT